MLEPNKWITNYGDGLYAFALKRVNNETHAEDIVQDVFLSAWKKRESYNAASSEKTWLYSICKNKIIDFYRNQNNACLISIDNSKEDEEYFTSSGHIQQNYKSFKEWNLNKHDTLENKDFFNVLNTCKSKLKKLQEQVFSLKHLEELDTTEICDILGITNKNYWILMHRAKMQLRVCIEKNWLK